MCPPVASDETIMAYVMPLGWGHPPHQFTEASRSFDLTPSEIEGWVEDAKRGMENSLRANPLDIREQ